MKEERRQHLRAKVSWPVRMEITKEHPGWWTIERKMRVRVEDISAGGAFICCEEPLSLNEEFSMAIAGLPLLNRQLSVDAEVIRSNIYCLDDETMCHGMGVRFTKIPDEDRELISTLVSDHLPPKGIDWREEEAEK